MRARVREITGVAVGAIAAAVVVLAVAAALASFLRYTTTAFAASAIALLPLALARPASRAVGPRGLVLVALVPLLFAPAIALVADAELNEPFLAAIRASEHNAELLARGALCMVPVGVVATLLLWLTVVRAPHRGLERAVRLAGIAAGAIVVSAVTWTATRGRLEPEDWIKTLRTVGHAHYEADCDLELREDNTRRYDLRVAAGTISVECRYADECNRAFIPNGAEQRYDGESVPFHEPYRTSPYIDNCGGYFVLDDPRHRMFVLEGPSRWPYWDEHFVAFSRTGRFLGPLRPELIGDVLAPPTTWLLAACAGVLCAVVAQLFASRRRSREWVDGRVADDWTIVLADGTRVVGGEHAPGTLVVAAGVKPSASTYRDAPFGSAARVCEGTAAERRQRFAAERAALFAWALASIAITAAPLLVFAARFVR